MDSERKSLNWPQLFKIYLFWVLFGGSWGFWWNDRKGLALNFKGWKWKGQNKGEKGQEGPQGGGGQGTLPATQAPERWGADPECPCRENRHPVDDWRRPRAPRFGTWVWKGVGQSQPAFLVSEKAISNLHHNYATINWTGHLGKPRTQLGEGGQKKPRTLTRNSWQPQRGKGGKNHPKRPRKEDFARWHHFSLIRRRLGGWGKVWKQGHLRERERGGVRGKGWERGATWNPDGNTARRDEV